MALTRVDAVCGAGGVAGVRAGGLAGVACGGPHAAEPLAGMRRSALPLLQVLRRHVQ